MPELRAQTKCPKCESPANVKSVLGDVVILANHGDGRYYGSACIGVAVRRNDVQAREDIMRCATSRMINTSDSGRKQAEEEYRMRLATIDAREKAAQATVTTLDKFAKKFGGGS